MDSLDKQLFSDKKRKAIPIMTHPGIEQTGKRVIDAVTNGEIHFKAIQAMADSYPAAASTVIMDLTVEAEAFGCKLAMTENEVPNVVGKILDDLSKVERLNIPSVTQGRIPEYLKANKLAAQHIGKPVLSGCIGPYSLAGRLYDMSDLMIAIYIEPEAVINLLTKCTDFILEYGYHLKQTGTAGIIIAEPAAGLLSNDDCYNYSTIFVQRIVNELQDESFSIILHNCGNTGQCTDAMVRSNATGLHFGNKIDLRLALQEIPTDIIVMGNIDPVSVFKQSSPTAVKSNTLELLKQTAEYPNFVLSTGCDVPPEVPYQNIDAFYEALYEFNNQ